MFDKKKRMENYSRDSLMSAHFEHRKVTRHQRYAHPINAPLIPCDVVCNFILRDDYSTNLPTVKICINNVALENRFRRYCQLSLSAAADYPIRTIRINDDPQPYLEIPEFYSRVLRECTYNTTARRNIHPWLFAAYHVFVLRMSKGIVEKERDTS